MKNFKDWYKENPSCSAINAAEQYAQYYHKEMMKEVPGKAPEKEYYERDEIHYWVDGDGDLYCKSKAFYVVGENSNQFKTERAGMRVIAYSRSVQLGEDINGDWEPDWDDNNEKWCIDFNGGIDWCITYNSGSVYFETKEAAQEAKDQLIKEDLYKWLK